MLADGKVGYGQGEGFRVAKVAVPAGVPGVVGDGAVGVIHQRRECGVPEDFRDFLAYGDHQAGWIVGDTDPDSINAPGRYVSIHFQGGGELQGAVAAGMGTSYCPCLSLDVSIPTAHVSTVIPVVGPRRRKFLSPD